MLTQTYRDITFVFGAPDGDRYEMLKETAHHKNLSFSEVYRTYMDEILLELHGEGVFDHAFSGAVGPKLKVNKIFPTYQHWRGREERFEKFFVSRSHTVCYTAQRSNLGPRPSMPGQLVIVAASS